MAKIIAVANSKGGVAKSSLARNIALVCQTNDLKTIALDCDPQASLDKFFRSRTEQLGKSELSCKCLIDVKTLEADILQYDKDYDRIIIDVGGRDTSTMRQVLLTADTVIIPTTTSQESIDALGQMIDVVLDVKQVNPQLQVFIIITMAPPDYQDTTAVLTASLLAENYKDIADVLEARIKYRKAWVLSGYDGNAIWELGSKSDNKAAAEFENFINELAEKGVL